MSRRMHPRKWRDGASARISVLNLSIRFQLAPGVQPGVYAWLLNVSVTPL